METGMTDIDFDKIKEGDEVWVRGKWLGGCIGEEFVRVSVDSCDLAIRRTAIVKHIPQPWVPEVGDVVGRNCDPREFTILAIDENVAWVKAGSGGRYVVCLSDLTLIRKGGDCST